MARYRPSAELRVAKACGESWEQMDGGARMRHCVSCDRDVVNVASLTPEQLEEHIAAAQRGLPLPCMRMVQFADGELLVAATEAKASLWQRAAMAASALVVLSGSALAQGPGKHEAVLVGRAVDPSGVGLVGADVELLQGENVVTKVKAGDDGTFTVTSVPGDYKLRVQFPGFMSLPGEHVVLREGTQKLEEDVRVPLVFIGEVVEVKKPVKTKRLKKS